MLDETPIYAALVKYVQENNIRLHMPGHVGRGILAQELKNIALLDVTEVPGLDDLHISNQAIEEARLLLARAFGARESFFLVNGATSGIHTLMMSLTSDQQKVLVPRNAHRSLFGGMVLSGAMPVYIPCQFNKDLGIALSVLPQDVEDLLRLNRDAEAVFLTSPSYYGTTCFLQQIAAIVRSYNKILAVDEAHGSHFPFHDLYPQSALQAGADMVINGLHKTLPVLNQGACLHMADEMPFDQQTKTAYSLLTTTSPSYPILASIDLARCFMEKQGEKLLARALEMSIKFRHKIRELKGIKCVNEELRFIPGVNEVDPLKVLIEVKDTGLSGFEVERMLREKYRIQVEMADHYFILPMFSIFHEPEDWQRLYQSLKIITEQYTDRKKFDLTVEVPPYPQVVHSPRQAFQAGKKAVKLKDSMNLIAGEMIAAYPPGIPCVLPGELITPSVWEYLNYLKATGFSLHGPRDRTLEYITVLD